MLSLALRSLRYFENFIGKNTIVLAIKSTVQVLLVLENLTFYRVLTKYRVLIISNKTNIDNYTIFCMKRGPKIKRNRNISYCPILYKF